MLEAQQLVAAGLTLLQRSAPLVRALSGKRSAILLQTSPAFLTALAASEGRGAVLINPLAAAADVAFQCADANVGALFTSSALAVRAPAGLPIVVLDDVPRFARVIAHGRTREVDLGSHHGLALELELNAHGRDEEAVIVYTSAMRGTPLGAVLTHANLLANARSTIQAAGNVSSDHVLALLPFSHLFGLTVTASAPLLVGARVTTMARFNPATAVELLAGDVTEVVGVPAIFRALLAGIARRGVRVSDGLLRLAICGGAALPRDLQDRWADVTGVELREGYGLTEAGPVCLVNSADAPNKRGTLGKPYPDVDVGIFAPANYAEEPDALPVDSPMRADGVPGEICVRGANVFRGYVGGKSGLPRRGEWLCTGDAGVRESDGTFRFLGMLKPMFTRNGFNIYPRELERAVSEMPGVVRCEVSSLAEPVKENEIRLRVWGAVGELDVKRWCEARLSVYKQPSVIEIVAEAPTQRPPSRA